MKDLDRIERAYTEKPLPRLKALNRKHHAHYITFWNMKVTMNQFGVVAPEFEARYMYYWRLTNMVNNLYRRRVDAPRLQAALEAKRAMYPGVTWYNSPLQLFKKWLGL